MKVRRLLVFLSLMIVFFLQQSIAAQAEGSSYLQVKVTTDKQAYTEKDTINYTLTISNATGSKAKNVVVKSFIPAGLEVTSKDTKLENKQAVWKVDAVDPFDQVTLNFSAKLKKGTSAVPPVNAEAENGKDLSGSSGLGSPGAPKTGDDTNFLPYYLIFIISAAILIGALILLKKNRVRKTATFILVLAMILPSFTAAKAEEKKETIKETHKVPLNNKEYTLNVSVEFTLDIDTTLMLKAKRTFGTPQLEWNPVEGATYQVKRAQTPGKLAVVGKDLTDPSYMDEESKSEEPYYYQVAAVKNGREIYNSNVILVQAYIDSDKDGLKDEEEKTRQTSVKNPDTDGDGLKDGEEVYLTHTDPSKKDTDDDGLLDSYEVSYFNETESVFDPIKKDTDGNGKYDGEEDYDQDKLTNLQEQVYKTNPFDADTDNDNLSDYDEIKTHHTDPLLKDTDRDGLDDDSELKFGTDPLKADSDGDGILDGKEKRGQEVTASDLNATLSFDATGDAAKTTVIDPNEFAQDLMGKEGMVGKPVEITTTSIFENAALTFSYDPNALGDIDEDNLSVFYFNKDTWQLELVKDQTIDKVNKKVTAHLEHFSTYLLADKAKWEETIIDDPVPISDVCSMPEEVKEKPLDLVFVIDSSGSMLDNDPNDFRISGAKEIINSLKGPDQAAVVSDQGAVVDFDSDARLLQGLTDDKELLKEAVDKIDSSGGTDIGAGVVVALDELKNKARKEANQIIILLTDGEGSYSDSYTTRAKDAGVKIFTIGLGNSVDEALLQAIAQGTEGDYYHTVSAEKIPELFEKARDVSQDVDTDKDCIVDWAEKFSERDGGYIVESTLGNVGTTFSSDYMKKHSDTDDLTDLEELAPADNPTIVAALPNFVTNHGKTKVHLKKWPRSNPIKTDTDGDSYNDKDDLKPRLKYKNPVVLIHGRIDNSLNLYGLKTLISNDTEKEQNHHYLMNNIDSKGKIIRSKSLSKNKNNYYNAKTHKISGVIPGEGNNTLPENLGFRLIQKEDYVPNEDLFVLNYPNEDFTWKNADILKWFIEENLKENKNVYPTLSAYSNRNKTGGTFKVDLVGHSNGGLVSRYYIENLKGSAYVNKLITMNTPHWGSGLATVGTIYPMDVDLRPASLQYGGKKRDIIDTNRDKEKYYNKYQTKALKYADHNTTQYYFIAGYDDAAPYLLPKELKGKTILFDVKPKSSSFEAFRDSIADGFYKKYPDFRSSIDFVFGESGGDNIVNNQSQLGVTYKDFGNGKAINADSYAMVIDTIFGHWALNNLHGQIPHRSETIDQVIQYLHEK